MSRYYYQEDQDPEFKQVWDEALKEAKKSLQENNKRFIDSLKTIGHSLVNQHKDYNDIIIFSNLSQEHKAV